MKVSRDMHNLARTATYGIFGKEVYCSRNNRQRVFLGTTEQYDRCLLRYKPHLNDFSRTKYFIFSSFGNVSPDASIHMVIPLFDDSSLTRDAFQNQRWDIMNYFAKCGAIINSNDVINIAQQACIQVHGIKKGVKGYYLTLTERSQKQYNQTVQAYLNGKTYDPENNLLGTPNYSHINLFAWIYYIESQLIRLLPIQSPINVFDFGCSFGNGIFTKAHLLPDRNIEYYGVDIDDALLCTATQYASLHGINNAHFLKADLSRKGWQESVYRTIREGAIDVITSSHLIEHLPIEPTHLIEEWIRFAKHAVVVSAPHTTHKICLSDHAHKFDSGSLINIAQEITAKYKKIKADTTFISSGIVSFIKDLS